MKMSVICGVRLFAQMPSDLCLLQESALAALHMLGLNGVTALGGAETRGGEGNRERRITCINSRLCEKQTLQGQRDMKGV